MSNDVNDLLTPVLRQDEKILWSGQPGKGIRMRRSDLFLIPVSLAWTVMIIVCEFVLLSAHTPPAFGLITILSTLVAFYLLIGRFILDAAFRDGTYYALTNQRVMLVSGINSHHLRSIDYKKISDLSFTRDRDGTGTIVFFRTPLYLSILDGCWPWFGTEISPRLEMIEDVEGVYRVIEEQFTEPRITRRTPPPRELVCI